MYLRVYTRVNLCYVHIYFYICVCVYVYIYGYVKFAFTFDFTWHAYVCGTGPCKWVVSTIFARGYPQGHSNYNCIAMCAFHRGDVNCLSDQSCHPGIILCDASFGLDG